MLKLNIMKEEKDDLDNRVSILGKLFMPFITEFDSNETESKSDKKISIWVGVISGVVVIGVFVWLLFFNK